MSITSYYNGKYKGDNTTSPTSSGQVTGTNTPSGSSITSYYNNLDNQPKQQKTAPDTQKSSLTFQGVRDTYNQAIKPVQYPSIEQQLTQPITSLTEPKQRLERKIEVEPTLKQKVFNAPKSLWNTVKNFSSEQFESGLKKTLEIKEKNLGKEIQNENYNKEKVKKLTTDIEEINKLINSGNTELFSSTVGKQAKYLIQGQSKVVASGTLTTSANFLDYLTKNIEVEDQKNKERMGDKYQKSAFINEDGSIKTREWSNNLKRLAEETYPVDNPNFSDQLNQGVGSMLPFLLTAVATRGQAVAGWLPTIIEASGESGSVYEENRNNGMEIEESAQKADLDFLANLVIGRITDKAGLLSDNAKGIVKKMFFSSSGEGVQEGFQQLASNWTTDKENVLEGVIESVGIGALLGGIMSPAFTDVEADNMVEAKDKTEEVASTINNESIKPEELKQDLPKKVNKRVVDPQEAIDLVLNQKIDQEEVGKQILTTALEAQQDGKMVEISEDQDSNLLTIKQVEASIEADTDTVQQSKPETTESVPTEQTPSATENDALIQEAKKYKSAEEFVKKVQNEGQLGNDGYLREIPISKISATDYAELDNALRTNKRLSISEAENMVSPTDPYKAGQEVKYPIEVRPDGQGGYTLVAGNHRLVQKLINGENRVLASVSGTGRNLKSQLTDIWNQAQKEATGQSKKAEKKAEVEPTTQERAVNSEVPGSELRASQRPIGTGKKKESRAYKRVRERLAQEAQEDVNYNPLNLKKDAENAVDYIASKPEEALQVAFGLREPPKGMTETAISIALADKAGRDKNFRLQSQLEASRSLRQTRRGQEIVSERGRFDENSPYYFVRQIIDRRLKNIGSGVKSDVVDAFNKALKDSNISSAKKKAINKIDRQAKELQTKIKDQFTRDKVSLALEIFESMKC